MIGTTVMRASLAQLGGRSLRHVAVLAGGTATAQVMTLAATPFITRLFGPQAYGAAGSFLALVSMLVPVAALAYPLAIVLPRRDHEARALSILSLGIGLALAIFATLVVALGQPLFERMGVALPWLLLLPLFMLLGCLRQVLEQWAHRLSRFPVSARVSVAQSIVANGGKIGAGLTAPVASTLVGMTLLAELAACGLYLVSLRKVIGRLFAERHEPTTPLRQLARQHVDFPLYRAPQMLVSSFSLGLPVLILGAWYGAAVAGYFVLARVVVTAPVTLIGKAITDVLTPRLAEASRSEQPPQPLIRKAMLWLAPAAALPMLTVILAGPPLFEWLFGSQWREAGEQASWLALWFYVTLVTMPCLAALPVLRLQRFHLGLTCCSAVARLGLLTACAMTGFDAVTSVAVYAISGALINMILASRVLPAAATAVQSR